MSAFGVFVGRAGATRKAPVRARGVLARSGCVSFLGDRQGVLAATGSKAFVHLPTGLTSWLAPLDWSRHRDPSASVPPSRADLTELAQFQAELGHLSASSQQVAVPATPRAVQDPRAGSAVAVEDTLRSAAQAEEELVAAQAFITWSSFLALARSHGIIASDWPEAEPAPAEAHDEEARARRPPSHVGGDHPLAVGCAPRSQTRTGQVAAGATGRAFRPQPRRRSPSLPPAGDPRPRSAAGVEVVEATPVALHRPQSAAQGQRVAPAARFPPAGMDRSVSKPSS